MAAFRGTMMKAAAGTAVAAALLLAGVAGAAEEHKSQATPNKLPKTFGVIFTSLQVRDIEKALAFYKAVFDVSVLYHYDLGDFKEYMMLFPGSPQAGGMNIVQRGFSTEPFRTDHSVHPVIKVTDLVGTCERILKAGGTIERPCYKPPPGTLEASFAHDLDGHRLEIIQYDY